MSELVEPGPIGRALLVQYLTNGGLSRLAKEPFSVTAVIASGDVRGLPKGPRGRLVRSLPTDGTAMGIRLSDRGWIGFLSARSAMTRNGHLTYPSWILLISMIVACGWMFFRADAANPQREPPALSAVIPDDTPSAHAAGVKESNVAPANLSEDEGADSNSPVRATPTVTSIDGVTVLRQSLRRGGLGSKALVTLTIRNSNDYAVNQIELVCFFRNRDGGYVTERRHRIDGVVKPNSRRTFRHMMVGFVSINANRAKCSVFSADWA